MDILQKHQTKEANHSLLHMSGRFLTPDKRNCKCSLMLVFDGTHVDIWFDSAGVSVHSMMLPDHALRMLEFWNATLVKTEETYWHTDLPGRHHQVSLKFTINEESEMVVEFKLCTAVTEVTTNLCFQPYVSNAQLLNAINYLKQACK